MRQGVPQCTKAHFLRPLNYCIFGDKKYNRIWEFGKT